jgi:hypothetical protein
MSPRADDGLDGASREPTVARHRDPAATMMPPQSALPLLDPT